MNRIGDCPTAVGTRQRGVATAVIDLGAKWLPTVRTGEHPGQRQTARQRHSDKTRPRAAGANCSQGLPGATLTRSSASSARRLTPAPIVLPPSGGPHINPKRQ